MEATSSSVDASSNASRVSMMDMSSSGSVTGSASPIVTSESESYNQSNEEEERSASAEESAEFDEGRRKGSKGGRGEDAPDTLHATYHPTITCTHHSPSHSSLSPNPPSPPAH